MITPLKGSSRPCRGSLSVSTPSQAGKEGGWLGGSQIVTCDLDLGGLQFSIRPIFVDEFYA